MGDSYEKRARQKRKAQKRREKAEQKRRAKEEGGEPESDEDVAARYLDPPEDADEE